MTETWWKESVVYQIYPRSFCDSDGDGIGDLQGIISKLDYIQNLGADVIWLSPIYRSPNDDNGYDISDYFKIMDEFGTLVDFEELLAEVHRRDMKLVMDLVVNHTSDEHPWFLASRRGPDNPFSDYYIWHPGQNGGPPNNWGSYFSESAWDYDPQRGQYYLHLFSKKQPDLNWDNPNVRRDVFAMMRWWLDKGIDGFRMDVINLISKDKDFPWLQLPPGVEHGIPTEYVVNGPRIHEFLREMKSEVLDLFSLMTVGEMPSITPQDAVAYVHEENGTLNMVFHFEHMSLDYAEDALEPSHALPLIQLKDVCRRWQEGLHGQGWNALYFNNHDQPRSVSRFGDDGRYRKEAAKMLAAVLFLQQGTPFVFQGEELAMTNCAFGSISDYRDVASKNLYRKLLAQGAAPAQALAVVQRRSRDNARTPMQWDATVNAGFSSGRPWIGVNPNFTTINAAQAAADPDSVYHFYRRLFALRRANDVLIYGRYLPLAQDDPHIFAYFRELDGEQVLILGNFSSTEQGTAVPEVAARKRPPEFLLGNYPSSRHLNGHDIRLEPFEVRVYRLS